MTERQSQLLTHLLERYIAKAEPISSGSLAERLHVSSATVRNELAALEEEGYISQPHTSAGRIPTLEAYRYYVRHVLQPKKPTSYQEEELKRCFHTQASVKDVAKEVSELTKQAVLVAFSRDDVYYTGLSRLFAQPEFQEQQSVINLSAVLDQLDEAVNAVYSHVATEPTILLGDEHPFSTECALIALQASFSSGRGVFAVLAPLRVDYARVVGILDHLKREWDQRPNPRTYVS